VSLIPAELRGPDVRQILPAQTTSRRMIDLYRRALVIPAQPEQVIPGTPEQVIPGTPEQRIPARNYPTTGESLYASLTPLKQSQLRSWVNSRPIGGLPNAQEYGLMDGFHFVLNGPGAQNKVLAFEGRGFTAEEFNRAFFIGSKTVTEFRNGVQVIILSHTVWVVPLPNTPEQIIPAVPDTIIPAVPDTIIPAVPETVSPGTVATIAMTRTASVRAGGMTIIHNGIAALGATRLRLQSGRLFGVPVLARAASAPEAIAGLRWILGGMPWFGGAWESALAGQWVRRAAWQDLARAVRYVAGGGTTRAVAVRETGERVTTADFGAEEFLATDWELLDGTAEPAEIDVTDWVFSGSGGVPFAVVASPATPDPTQPLPPTTGLPQTGEGFVYMRNGTPTLVRGRKLNDESIWRP
jgi:hypothetical protein